MIDNSRITPYNTEKNNKIPKYFSEGYLSKPAIIIIFSF